MRTVTFKRILDGVATRLGLDPEQNLQPNQAASIATYCTSRVRYAWEFMDWPEIRILEERAFRNAYDNDADYEIGAEVYYSNSDAYFTCIAPSNGNLPTDTNYWEPLSPLVARVDFEQNGKSTIGDVFGAWLSDPRSTATPIEVAYFVDSEAIYFPDFSGATKVWVRFRPVVPIYSAKEWSAVTAYVTGDVRYLAAKGECYLALQDSTNENPATSTAYWEKQIVPYIFAEWLQSAAFADVLREDGATEKATLEDSRAEGFLIREADKVWFQQGQQPAWSAAV